MGNKLQEQKPTGDPYVDGTEKKKKRNKSKSDSIKAELVTISMSELTQKRKLEESETKEMKIKKKKHQKETLKEDAISEEAAENVSKLSADNVTVSGADSGNPKYMPLKFFSDSKLPDNVLKCCEGFKHPSAIQAHAWPYLLDGRDFIGIAKTGSGKTLAYGIPAIMHVLKKHKENQSNRRNPLCLVLAPTRELADQIYKVVCESGKPCGVTSVCVYGGVPKGPQVSSFKAGVDVVIGTPGRLKDLIEMNVCRLSSVSFVVLDEADRMLDMGFRQEVKSILENTNSSRQTIMLSATWPLDVHNLAEEHMNTDPIKIVIGSEDTAANHDVMQIVEVLEDHSRDDRLLALLEKYHKSKKNRVLVFALYQKEAERLEQMLKSRGWKVVGIHGNKAQNQRTKALALFKDGSCPLMVATDVAARGLDVPDVEVVINYSFPLTTEDYVHRIGRTGRAGKKGVAHTFFTHHNKGLSGELINVLREAGQVVPPSLLKFGTHVKKKESKLYGAHFKEIKADAPKAKRITFNSDDED